MKYDNETSGEVMDLLKGILIDGYESHFEKNSNGDYNHLQNFFIWKKKDKKEYIRICLIGGFDKVYYWSVDFNFKPFNKKKCKKWSSEKFQTNEDYLELFKKAVEEVEDYVTTIKIEDSYISK